MNETTGGNEGGEGSEYTINDESANGYTDSFDDEHVGGGAVHGGASFYGSLVMYLFGFILPSLPPQVWKCKPEERRFAFRNTM